VKSVAHVRGDSGDESETYLHPARRCAAERGETEHLRVMFVREVVDPAEAGRMRIHFIFRCNVHEAVSSISKFGPPKFNSSRAFTNFASIVVR
jgi:hypothetical protein